MDLLPSLLKCFQSSTSEYNNLNEEELKIKVRKCLKGKKYLIVLDDIWNTRVWDEIRDEKKDVIPDEQNGSRILITSRKNDVAFYCGTSSPYYFPFLNKEESWELFHKKVFRGEECSNDLKTLGRSIAESCRGLPLGIIVLAGLARKKRRTPKETEREWLRLKEITWHMTQDKTEVMDIFKLSYDSLPRRLKLCFMYFAIYPEDYEIRARQLMQIWMAEGFIQPKQTGITNPPEEIAEYYLDELVDCSLVQVARRRFDGGVKRCRIHDLLRDLCISESKSTELLEICTEANMHTLRNPRRLSLYGWRAQSYLSFVKGNQSSTRSLFFFSKKRYQHDHVMENFKLTRVLYAEALVFSSLCTGLKNMILLRYLKVSTYVTDIPASICSLRNLETLHFEQIGSTSILRPLTGGMGRCTELSSLTKLRSIKLIDFPRLPLEFPSNVVKITLQATSIGDNKDIMKTLGRLTNLQILKLKNFHDLSDLTFAAGEFPRLRVFQMTFIFVKKWRLEKGATPNLQYILISLCNRLDELPEELWSLTSLRHVCVLEGLSRPLRNSLENVERKNGCKLSILSHYEFQYSKWG